MNCSVKNCFITKLAVIQFILNIKQKIAEKNGITFIINAETTDLKSIASSLGADTDYLNVVNYRHDDSERPVSWNVFTDYLWNLSVTEACYAPAETFSAISKSGSCLGISSLEVLSHNGVIKPSDIQSEASTLNEISYNNEIDRIITNYQCLQGYTEFDSYEKFLVTNLTYNEQIERLIETAENSMKENKYFLITVRSEGFSHAICGIGMADGDWEWNGEKYDKCILTLDSNVSDTDGNAKGFSENACIYINSETKHCYIPSYEISIENDPSFTVIDDDTIINHRGTINPSETIRTDVSGIKQVSCNTSERTKLYAVSDDGNMTLFDEASFSDWAGKANFIRTDSVHIDIDDELTAYPNFRYINSDRWIDIEFLDDSIAARGVYNADIDISDNNIYMKCNEGNIKEIGLQIRMNEGTYDCSPFFWWIMGIYDLSDDVNVEVRDNGILLKSNGHIKAGLTPYCYQLDDNGHFLFNKDYTYMDVENINSQYTDAVIESDNNVFVSIENQEIVYYIDKNGDDVYDDKVEKGDVNCDGFIDAVDASLVLAKYAANSTASSEYIGVGLALGDYNNDGLVDAVDATEIFIRYAELSTT